MDIPAAAKPRHTTIGNDRPQASLVIPAYESDQTIGGCLSALREQTFSDFETIVVDSSPGPGVERLVTVDFPEVRFRRSERRLLPHDARNLGARLARSDLLVFTDPDVYPAKEWLEILVAEFHACGDIIVGSVECYGRRWIDVGTHICKFDKWLAGGNRRPIDIAPTVNMLCTREVFERTGEFRPDRMIGDTLFSWKAIERGYVLRFVPSAVVYHHHLNNLTELLRERYARGREFAETRSIHHAWSRSRAAVQLVASVLPLRLLRILARGAQNAIRAGHGQDYLRTLPIVVSGQAAWLAGESAGHAAWVGRPQLSEGARSES